jgi:hypothetical protein
MNSMLKAVLKMAIAIALAAVMVGCEGDPLSTHEKATLLGGGLGAATGTINGPRLVLLAQALRSAAP